jgi:hypothetical protein
MDDAQVRRITGFSAVAMALTTIVAIPLYFMYEGPPPAWNVFTRDLVGLITCALLIVFFAGFSQLLRRSGPAHEWAASIFHTAGMLFVAVALVAISLEAGVVFGAPDGTLDPTTDGPLAHGNILIHGPIKRLLTAILLLAAGFAVIRTRIVPAWMGRAAYAIALFNLVFVPSIYFGKDATQFYSALGWGNSAFCASFLAYWIVAVGISLLRRPRAG